MTSINVFLIFDIEQISGHIILYFLVTLIDVRIWETSCEDVSSSDIRECPVLITRTAKKVVTWQTKLTTKYISLWWGQQLQRKRSTGSSDEILISLYTATGSINILAI